MDQLILPNAEPIPGYRLLERLGRGGYGEVWKASAPGGMHKAIKFVYGDMEGIGDSGQGAEQEFKSLNRVKSIRHPFILSIERFDVINGRLTIVMELADRNLWDRYSECVGSGLPGIPREELLRYMEEAAEALDLMNVHHQLQHLDVKPHNIFLVHQHVKVADFGLAKDLEGARTVVTGGVTPTYAPPETFEGWVSRQSDQYSLAIVYQEMLTGRRPFQGTSTRQLVLQHMTGTPDLSDLASPDREAVAQALAKAPDDRFKTCSDFVKALKGTFPVRPMVRPGLPVPRPAADTPTEALCDTDASPSLDTGSLSLSKRSLPALVTRRSKSTIMAAVTQLRRTAPDTGVLSRVGPPPPERTGDGVLVPTLIIGVGGTGLATLRRLRQLILNRFGVATLPHLRWLFVDTDPAAVEDAVTGGPAFHPEEVLLARLHRPAHYLTREGLPAVDSWLSAEELYRMPKTPATKGVRAIGRLALCDHHHALCSRVRSALEAFMKPEALAAADRQTGLGLRHNHPRVYLAASLAGGTGSGMFVDLAYLTRRELRHVGFPDSHVTGLLAVPAHVPQLAATVAAVNTRAALTELAHFSQAGSVYEALFDTREKPVTDAGRPFRRCAAVTLPAGGEAQDALRTASVLAHTAFAEMLTPMGRAAQPDDLPPAPHPFGLVGVRKLVWPRADILGAAGLLLARSTLQRWLTRTLDGRSRVPGDVVAAQWHERHLDRSGLRTFLSTSLDARFGRPLSARIEEIVGPTADADPSDPKAVTRVRRTLDEVLNFLGRPGMDEIEQPNEVGRLLTVAVTEVTGEADKRLSSVVASLLEQPGLRLAGAEEALRHLHTRIDGELEFAEDEARLFEDQAVHQLTGVLTGIGQFGKEGGRATRPAIEPAALLRQWAITRFQALIARACANVYRVLRGNLPEFTREINVCRGQLADFIKDLGTEPEKGEDGLQFNVFVGAAETVAEAAAGLIAALTPDEAAAFETGLQDRVRRECRGVVTACVRPAAEGERFKLLIVDEATRFLDDRLERRPASHVLLDGTDHPAELDRIIRQVVEAAGPVPPGPGAGPATTLTVLGMPADEGSYPLRAVVRDCAGGSAFSIAALPTEIVVLREARAIPFRQLPHLSGEDVADSPAVAAFVSRAAHSRADVAWDLVPSS